MAKQGASSKMTVKNIHGQYQGLDIFQYFNDGIRKRLPKYIAKTILEDLKRNIERNRYRFQLSEDWINYKKRVGAEDKPFVMFGYYKRAIQVVTKDGHLSVGFKKSTIHPRNNISMTKLAVALEYGDLARGRPARPLWRNTIKDFLRKNKDVGVLIKKAIDADKII